MVRQQMLCIVTPRWPGQSRLAQTLAGGFDSLFTALGTVHFASLALLPPEAGNSCPALPHLMLEITIDEGLPVPVLLDQLVARGFDLLWQVYGCYQIGQVSDEPAARAAWLRALLARHLSEANCAFVGARDRTVRQILAEHDLYSRARDRALALTANERIESDWLARKLADWAQATREFDWARRPAPRCFWRTGGLRRVLGGVALLIALVALPFVLYFTWQTVDRVLALPQGSAWFLEGLWWALKLLITTVVVVLGALLLAAVGLVVLTQLAAWARRLSLWLDRWHRLQHVRTAFEVPRAHQVHASVLACEAALRGRPNHIISLTDVRAPRRWQALWLRFFLAAISWVGVLVFVHGLLGKASGIKYGHWHVIDGGRRLLFCSNYDGAFGGYLDEFIAGATVGVNLFWGRTHLPTRSAAAMGQPAVTMARNFPPRRWLACHGGCEHEQAFKAYARDSMLPHLYVFQAYRWTQGEIERATRVRDALFGLRNSVNDEALARALES